MLCDASRIGGSNPSPVRQLFRLWGINSGLQTVGRNMEINGKRIIIEGRVPRIARLEQEWCDDAGDPEILVDALRKTADGPDILTFSQRLPDLAAQIRV